MPIYLKPSVFKVKDENGQYVDTNILAQESAQEYIDAIDGAGVSAVQAIEAKAQQTISSIPNDYTQLSDDVTDLKGDLDAHESIMNGVLSLEEMTEIPFKIAGVGRINSSGNVVTDTTNYKYTDYISFEPFTHMKYKRGGVTVAAAQYIAVYDSDKNFITNVRWASNQDSNGYLENLSGLTKQEGFAFVRFTMFADVDTYGEFAVYGDKNSYKSKTEEIEEKIEEIKVESDSINNADIIPYKIGANSKFINANTGVMTKATEYAATDFVDISKYTHLMYARLIVTVETTTGGVAFYTAAEESAFISESSDYCGVNAAERHYEERIIPVPSTAKYARFTLYSAADGFYIKGIKKNILEGLKLSLLGASIETFTGVIPEGNDVYYNGSRAGISNVNEMWWKILCNNTGMTPLIIDAWSGSGVCYNYSTDSTHSDTRKIPMCSDLRTGRLHNGDIKPDIILIVGGTNDWTYSESTTTPLGNWDGKTAVDRQAVVSGQSTFMESYASMIAKLHENYPEAILVGFSLEFCCRGTNLGITRVNSMGYTESDYSDAIERVCKIMGIPYLDVYNVGFNFDNYYPNYAEDSETETTHPNAYGHAVIAKKVIKELPRLVKQFKG